MDRNEGDSSRFLYLVCSRLGVRVLGTAASNKDEMNGSSGYPR